MQILNVSLRPSLARGRKQDAKDPLKDCSLWRVFLCPREPDGGEQTALGESLQAAPVLNAGELPPQSDHRLRARNLPAQARGKTLSLGNPGLKFSFFLCLLLFRLEVCFIFSGWLFVFSSSVFLLCFTFRISRSR